ncbi:hypothetical protein D187_000241 [Cystobacter fuscus DSM 2262]|uniref:Uncharacterized protein n=1 Tax=Cystobacter fuscus (strain ATCC 25194 / DSM 2262 / NBRC 100088 / M29) TaxID=1242864 RepID=S9QU08_CYSF2|nr:hypothetical protein D187_000241 [Cystobacter fuscus DSM 2262]
MSHREGGSAARTTAPGNARRRASIRSVQTCPAGVQGGAPLLP